LNDLLSTSLLQLSLQLVFTLSSFLHSVVVCNAAIAGFLLVYVFQCLYSLYEWRWWWLSSSSS